MENKQQPIFPITNGILSQCGEKPNPFGLTKLEYASIMAMQGLRAGNLRRESTTNGRTYYYPESSSTIAKMAVEDAKALLTELEK